MDKEGFHRSCRSSAFRHAQTNHILEIVPDIMHIAVEFVVPSPSQGVRPAYFEYARVFPVENGTDFRKDMAESPTGGQCLFWEYVGDALLGFQIIQAHL